MALPSTSPARRGVTPAVPALLSGALGAQRRRLLVAAQGRVLDLGGASDGVPLGGLAASSVVIVDAAGSARADGDVVRALTDLSAGDRFDTVVGVGALARASDPAAVLSQALSLLRPGGRLALVEPYRPPGWRGRLGSLLSGPVSKRFGLRPDLAVVDLVRNAGFALASTERMTMPTLVAPLRWFVRVTAERPVDAPERPPADRSAVPA